MHQGIIALGVKPPNTPFKDWPYYAHMFANGNIELTASFFWEQAEVALAYAKALDD